MEGYNALTLKDYRAYYRSFAPESVMERRINPLTGSEELGSPLLSALGARWILTQRLLPDDRFPLRLRGRFRVHENPSALPRAYLAEEILSAPGDPEGAVALLRARGPGSRVAVVEKALSPLPPGRAGEGSVGEWLARNGGGETAIDPAAPLEGTVLIVSREPERVVIDCAADRARMLVLTDAYYPGWKAAIDGRPAGIHRVNRIFRGVVLPPGVHRVEFAYRPLSLSAGAALSLLALAALAVRGRARSKALRAPGECR
ncbi:MAG: YfhO family protein [Candidatus Eisenbacteria bacterium]